MRVIFHGEASQLTQAYCTQYSINDPGQASIFDDLIANQASFLPIPRSPSWFLSLSPLPWSAQAVAGAGLLAEWQLCETRLEPSPGSNPLAFCDAEWNRAEWRWPASMGVQGLAPYLADVPERLTPAALGPTGREC
jgi:hypothetical protein